MNKPKAMFWCVDYSNTPKEEAKLVFSLLWDFLKFPTNDNPEVLPIDTAMKMFSADVDFSNPLNANLEFLIRYSDGNYERFGLTRIDHQWYRVLNGIGDELGLISKIGYEIDPN